MLEAGAFRRRQLAPLRLVNRALCAAASDPSLYRGYTCDSVAAIEALPPFVANSIHRLKLFGKGIVDLGIISRLVPSLTALSARGRGLANAAGAALALRELYMGDDSVWQDTEHSGDVLTQLASLENLQVARLDRLPPVALLSGLRRLCLHRIKADGGDLMHALASAPCAVTLEAVHLELWLTTTMSSGWWVALAELRGLREFGLTARGFRGLTPEDAGALANVLADHPTIDVFNLCVSNKAAGAVLRRGFSSNLRVLRIQGEFEDLMAVLPPNLAALQFLDTGRGHCSAADVDALLSRCPRLRALAISCDDEAIECLTSGTLGQPLLLLRQLSATKARVYDANATAGHKLGYLEIGVHWRIAGGVVFDGKAIGV